MTSKSSGLVNTCWSVMSAIASLITMPAPGFPIGILHHGPPSNSSAPKYFFAISKPQSRNAPSVNFMMLPLCTRVTLLRWFVIAYVIALWIKRTLPERLTGLMPIPTQTSSLSGAPTIFQNSPAFSFVPKRILSNCFGNSFCRKLRIFCDTGVNVFRVFPEDHHIDFLRMLNGRGDTSKVLYRPQAHEKIEKLPERNVE